MNERGIKYLSLQAKRTEEKISARSKNVLWCSAIKFLRVFVSIASTSLQSRLIINAYFLRLSSFE